MPAENGLDTFICKHPKFEVSDIFTRWIYNYVYYFSGKYNTPIFQIPQRSYLEITMLLLLVFVPCQNVLVMSYITYAAV